MIVRQSELNNSVMIPLNGNWNQIQIGIKHFCFLNRNTAIWLAYTQPFPTTVGISAVYNGPF